MIVLDVLLMLLFLFIAYVYYRANKSVVYTVSKPFFIKLWMEHFKYDGLATVWNTVYLKDCSKFSDQKLMRHETKHIEQMDRDGRAVWLVKYFYHWYKYGYSNIPYEIEARKAEDERNYHHTRKR